MSRRFCWACAFFAAIACVAVAQPALCAPVCTFRAVVGQNFGNYNVLSINPVKTVGRVQYVCSGFAPGSASVTLTLSTGNAPTYVPRYMLHAGVHLNYNLYVDNARLKIFGDGTPGTFIYGPVLSADGVVKTVNIFGLLPAKQNVTAGVYTDTITATMNY